MGTTFIARGRRANGRELDTSAAKHAVNRRDQGNNLLERWQAARDKLSDGRRRLVDGILEHLDETVFLTSPELAARTSTSSSPMVCLPKNKNGFVRGLVAVSLWIACAALAPLGAWAAPPQVTAPEPAPAPAAVSDVNATSPRADLNDGATLESFFDGVFDVGMKEHHVAGAAVAVVKDGQLLFTKGYGYQDIDRAIPVDPHKTLFRIGSTTKLFTWTSVMQLVEQGKLDLDKDVNTYLKDVKIPATYDKPITLRDIMTHTSGFEEGFLGYLITNDPEKQIPIKEAMQRHMPARVRPPGVMSSYSNYATALAGLKIGRAHV